MFTVFWLGWLDTRALDREYFVAVADDGKEYEVPSNYFYAASITVAQQRMPRMDESFRPIYTLLTTKNHDVMVKAKTCELPVSDTVLSPETLATLEKFIKEHHMYVVSHADANGRVNYDLYPHHIWSNPFLFTDFYNLDKRRITAYKYVMDASCLSYEDGGKIVQKPVAHKEFVFDVSGKP